MKDANYFLNKAGENCPKLIYTDIKPDKTEFVGTIGDSVLLDLGNHAVGHFSFSFDKLYTLSRFSAVLKSIGDNDYQEYASHLNQVRIAAKKHFYNETQKAFINKNDTAGQNVHAQVWMILGGVCDGEEAKNLLLSSIDNKKFKQPVTPYMRHYVIEAMFKLNMKAEAVAFLKKFWGGMVELGADTFWEAYIPDDLEFSPYKDRMINSQCHAWSCTPTYFIRKYEL